MNYELAKKLKEAGFPQGDGEDYNPFRYINKDGVYDYCNIDGSFCYTPTLSELIEACGRKFWKLEFAEGNIGSSFAFVAFSHLLNYGVAGSTPEEAVANLWLELNRK